MKKRGPSSTQPRPTKPRWVWPAAIAAVVAAAAVTFWTTTNLNNKTIVAEPPSAENNNVAQPPPAVNAPTAAAPSLTPPPPAAYQPRNIEPAPNIPAPGPITLAPSQLTIGSHADANPLDFAFHPSRFADPSHVANRIGIVTLDLDPDPTTNVAQPPSAVNNSVAQPPPAVTPYARAVELERARAFAMSLTLDLQNNLWVGTEDGGVQKYDPTKPPLEAWTQFTTKDGLGDNNGYAIATDHQGRIWVGHLNHGVSVYNGQKWQTYEVVAGLSRPDTLAGPLGERIFSIEVAPNNWPLTTDNSPTFKDPLTEKLIPLSGSVWMCSSAGLAVYAPTTDSWHYFTRADGLPSDQANALAFAPDGTLYLATQCDGIAIASPSDHYATWKQIQGPDELPTTPTGTGLPTNLMNDILVAKDGTVYAATTAGLAFSKDKGNSWQFIRGKDYADKVRGRNGGPPEGWTAQGGLLSEDFCTFLTEGQDGLQVGHWTTGSELLSLDAKTTAFAGGDFVTSSVAQSSVSLVANYGTGVGAFGGNKWIPNQRPPQLTATFPRSAENDAPEILERAFAKIDVTRPSTIAAFMGDDWATQGDWVARFGRSMAVLWAMDSPQDRVFSRRRSQYTYKPELLVPIENDKARSWIQSLIAPDRRSLYDPHVGIRRTAGLDDHGEAYPRTRAGGLAIAMSVPEGLHRVSAYFLNDNGHVGVNRWRDYSVALQIEENGVWRSHANARVEHHWGGVYKQFVVKGPANFRLGVDKGTSHNVMCAGLFVDWADEGEVSHEREPLLWMGNVRLGPEVAVRRGAPQAAPNDPHDKILSRVRQSPAAFSETRNLLLRLYRTGATSKVISPEAASRLKWELGLWSNGEQDRFVTQTALAWRQMQDRIPQLRDPIVRPNSPNTQPPDRRIPR